MEKFLNESSLLDSFERRGRSLDEFKQLLMELQASTKFISCKSKDVTLFSVTGNVINNKMEMNWLQPYQVLENGILRKGYVNLDSILKMGDFQCLIDEMVKNTKLLFHYQNKALVTSNRIWQTLSQRIRVSGDFLLSPSIYRDMLVANQFEKNFPMMLMGREINGVVKIFACFSDQYEVIPQTIIADIVEEIGQYHMFGEVNVLQWTVNHDITEIMIEFPEKAKEFQKTYGISKDLIPGLRITTSDTGTTSFTVEEIWRQGCSYSVQHTMKKKHKGTFTVDDILDDLDRFVFPNYTKLPEALSTYMQIDLDEGYDLAQEIDRNLFQKDIAELVKNIFKEIKLTKIVGKKREMSIRAQLLEEFDYTEPYTLYDVVIRVMSLSDRVQGLGRNVMKGLEEAVGMTPYCKCLQKNTVNAANNVYLTA